MTPTTPDSLAAPPTVGAQASPITWLRKNLFSDWFNSLLTLTVGVLLALALRGMFIWVFRLAQWQVIPTNIGLFMTGLYPSEIYHRTWIILGMIVTLAGFSWGLLGRNLSTLFSRNVLIGLALICGAIILVPLTRPNSPILLGMVILTVATAWAGRQLGRRLPGLGQALSAAWLLSYFIALWLIAGGTISASLLCLVLVIAASAVVGWQVATHLSPFFLANDANRGFRIAARGFWLLEAIGLLVGLGFLLRFMGFPGSLSVVVLVFTIVLALFIGLFLSSSVFINLWLFLNGFALSFLGFGALSRLLGVSIEAVPTSKWGGLVLTLFLAVTGIALCFPIGILLALGRRSELPIIRWLSVAYIELIRGVPLISILFMGQVLIPMFLPFGVRPNSIIRAAVGLTIFSSAYLAENVRAGLQAIPRGQFEAAASLGLNKPLTLLFIVLPQALKVAIPAIVGQFISLFQDTTLLGIVGLVELLGISNSVLANPKFLGRYGEVYIFIAIIYWFFCYAMSLGSRQIEKTLNTDH